MMTDKKEIEWLGNEGCDFCHRACGEDLYDAKTCFGSWAVMDYECFQKYGIAVAPGYGQHYKKTSDGRYVKVEG